MVTVAFAYKRMQFLMPSFPFPGRTRSCGIQGSAGGGWIQGRKGERTVSVGGGLWQKDESAELCKIITSLKWIYLL